jgi:8-oxo-dGTP pyrophosphatase MutT (NUDIX family)
MRRIPRDVCVHLVRREAGDPRYLMLRRTPGRSGGAPFWQPVSGAPLPGESDLEAAVREVREETRFDVSEAIFPLGVHYSYALRPELAERWEQLYGPGVSSISVAAFGAEVRDGRDPVLDPAEHDAFAWCSFEEAFALLDWPVEQDALAGRRQALRALADAVAPATN